ncbi:hypothetical protein [Helicobacter labetoulli]|uniref:hypothetical protein n=1 Tax=Helicobacter labetoulli TaxID=2315333 RepID=UPI000EF6BD32|nr:hypothetical protein [Helicobacter labetoulli]
MSFLLAYTLILLHFGDTYTLKQETKFLHICEGKMARSMRNLHNQLENGENLNAVSASALANEQTQNNLAQWLDTRFFVAIVNEIDTDSPRGKKAGELFSECFNKGVDSYLETMKNTAQKQKLKAFLDSVD